MILRFEVNGEPVSVQVPPDRRLLDVLREDLSLLGTKEGCGKGSCGACTVLLNDRAVNSCLVLACQVQGANVVTVEGLARAGKLHELQQAFLAEGAVQCGFCTPGMLMSLYALLATNRCPAERDIREAISGNLCRCTGYGSVVRAVRRMCKDS